MLTSNLSHLLELVKLSIPLKTSSQDTYLENIIKAVDSELQDTSGIPLDYEKMDHVMFVVDMVRFRYENRHEQVGVPRNLETRFYDLWY